MSKKSDLEKAQEYERKAKALREKVRKENRENRIKLSERTLEILEKVVGRKLAETDIDGFEKYAHGIGSQYIKKSMQTSEE